MVDGGSKELTEILKTLEGNMSGGKVTTPGRGLPRGDTMLMDTDDDAVSTRLGLRPTGPSREDSNASFGMSGLGVQEDEDDGEAANDPRAWLKIIDAYEHPRLLYNVQKKHFERVSGKPSLLPPALHKTTVFRNRYHVIHQRLLRNEAFQTSYVSASRKRSINKSLSSQQSLKITPIANLLGRHGSNHMLLGQLNLLPTGDIAISDLTGTIALDLKQAVSIPHDSAWFCPGMIVLIDGVYEEEDESSGKGLGGSSGVGGTLGGHFQTFFIGQPPCEKRKATLGISGPEGGADHTIGGGFGWIDFLDVGSERAVGAKMRRLEQRLLHSSQRKRIVMLGELNLDQPRVLQALRKILSLYASDDQDVIPLTFVLAGNFTSHAVMARGGSGGSIEYKEYFDALASTLADFPSLLRSSTFVFVPGDNDGWVSSFTAGASTPIPRKGVPEMFTSRIRRVFAQANGEANLAVQGQAVWASNPSRLSLFGPNHEIVIIRDDVSARLRRTSITLKPRTQEQNSQAEQPAPEAQADAMDLDSTAPASPTPAPESTDADAHPAADGQDPSTPHDIHAAQKLVKSILDQGYLAPFRQSIRPVHWDYASALHLYPLPTAMCLVDTSAPPFCLSYEGCHVVNPGSVLVTGRKGVGRWVEYEIGGVGRLKECTF